MWAFCESLTWGGGGEGGIMANSIFFLIFARFSKKLVRFKNNLISTHFEQKNHLGPKKWLIFCKSSMAVWSKIKIFKNFEGSKRLSFGEKYFFSKIWLFSTQFKQSSCTKHFSWKVIHEYNADYSIFCHKMAFWALRLIYHNFGNNWK